MINPKAAFAGVREKRPFVDHLVRTYQRYQADGGDRLASSVTFYWFLSLFPILLIAVYVTRQALGDDAGRQITGNLGPYLGAAGAKAVAKVVQDSAGKAGIIGLVGTLFSGLGWIDALREAIRTMWHQSVKGGNIVTRKVADVLALVGLFAVIAASVFVTGAATATTDSVLSFLGLSHTAAASTFTKLLSYALATLVDVGVFLWLFVRLAKVPTPLRRVAKGALFGAVGFEVLKAFGAYYIAHTTSKGEATYGTFATVVGMLVFLNLVSRLVLYTAAFTVTAPYDGVPVTRAAPLREDRPVERSWSPKPVPVPVEEPSPPPAAEAPLPGEKQVVLAARAVTAAGIAVVAAVGLYGLKTATRVVRR